MKIRHLFLLLCAGTLCMAACNGAGEADASFDTSNVPCTCGEPFNDIEGCSHDLCMSGEGNADNPDCVCGQMAFTTNMEDR